ncbi:MAG: ABC transporter ATP-binding protein [Arenicellales bacterium]
MSSPLLAVENLWVQFRVHDSLLDAVRGVSFEIHSGKTLALVGESGSGKSVIARSIMGILPSIAQAYNGKIILTEKDSEPVDLLSLDPNGSRLRGFRGGSMSMIFQEPMVSLSPLHTVGDQVSEALHLHRDVSAREGREICLEMLKMVGFSDPARSIEAYPFELSGGMRQRAMIAMALICRPSLLIADEPTTALDVTIQAQILQLINQLQSQMDMAVLMITHDLGVVANVADDVVVIYHGEVMESGTVQHIFSEPKHAYTLALLKAVPHIDLGKQQRLVPVREVHAEVGAFLEARRKQIKPDSGHNQQKPLLEIRNLEKVFYARSSAWSFKASKPVVKAVDNVSLTIGRGECVGLVGESGSGKSTLGKLIAHAILPDRGQILYHDGTRDFQIQSLNEEDLFEYRCKVQYMFQDPVGSLNPSMTVFDILREPMIIHKIGDRDYQAEMCKELMRLVGLDPRFLRRYPHSFSGGQRQRIGIARALALQPALLICDEPVSALDVSIQAQVLNLMRDLQKELGLSYLFVSHNLAVVDYVSDKVAVMFRGKLVEIAPADNLFHRAMHPYTRSLLQAVPVADLNRLLEFDKIAEFEDGSQWPDPFTDTDEITQTLQEIAPDHYVLAREGYESDSIYS